MPPDSSGDDPREIGEITASELETLFAPVESLLGFVTIGLSRGRPQVLLALEEPESEELSLVDGGTVGVDEQLVSIGRQGNERFERANVSSRPWSDDDQS